MGTTSFFKAASFIWIWVKSIRFHLYIPMMGRFWAIWLSRIRITWEICKSDGEKKVLRNGFSFSFSDGQICCQIQRTVSCESVSFFMFSYFRTKSVSNTGKDFCGFQTQILTDFCGFQTQILTNKWPTESNFLYLI